MRIIVIGFSFFPLSILGIKEAIRHIAKNPIDRDNVGIKPFSYAILSFALIKNSAHKKMGKKMAIAERKISLDNNSILLIFFKL
jgi:hypothetical protein